MRTIHDGIMVGINTVLNDNPQLNSTCHDDRLAYPLPMADRQSTTPHTARHLPPLPATSISSSTGPVRYHLPRPIVLDTHLRFPLDCKLLKNYEDKRGRRPWVLASPPRSEPELEAWQSRRSALEAKGARVIEVPASDGAYFCPIFTL